MNANVKLQTLKLALIPYRKEHVLVYHEWMKDPLLLKLTCSEPLTLEEEYEMQESWLNDESKLTFIISVGQQIIGDVNLYQNQEAINSAEIEVMIAVEAFRRIGIAQDALNILMHYSSSKLNVTNFIAKIAIENTPSINLFKKLGFVEVGKSDYFQQVTLESTADTLCEQVTYLETTF
jgi:RimJ/RimL family protein N-acetyltransferase